MKPIALTGGTGFVGRRTVELAVAQGVRLRALARSPQPRVDGVEWVAGALEDGAALARLCDGASAVVHIAGAINARDRAGFAAANVAGTQALIAAANGGGVPLFVHVSSLSAREPQLSDYGWSKAQSEAAVRDAARGWDIVRPPAVYGPGDRETLALFAMAARGLVLLPPAGRLSLIHVDDLAGLLLALARSAARGATIEPDDGRPGGWSHDGFARALGRAVGRATRVLALPAPVVALGAMIDEARSRWTGRVPRLSRDRARYMVHPDWTVDPAARPDARLWTPRIDTEAGLAATAAWYRAAGWLPSSRRN